MPLSRKHSFCKQSTCIPADLEKYLYLTVQLLEKIMVSVSLRLPDEVTRRLENLTALTGRSKTFYMVEAIREHIDDMEDLYLAEQRLIDIRAGKTKTVPLEEVMKRHGMED
jgi:RHH-type rel operon transcriptional repressor/antitoxin RelB